MDESPLEAYHDDIGLLTSEDMAFIHDTLGRDILNVKELNSVLNNPKLRSQVLDSPALLDAVNKNRETLCISEYFYFTTVVRQVMLAAGLEAPEYTQNVSSSLVRMSGMRRKLLDRKDTTARYVPVNLDVLREDGKFGSSLRISCRMSPYEMVLEGILADDKAFQHDNITIAASGGTPGKPGIL